ncbi:MAG TPA: Omp28-related outer membrane protein [Bacteroidia bacterium]|nr:Omp28-related outer membrane protein [Bacteroidia bacterium]
MKRIFIIAAAVIGLTSCKEENPGIILTKPPVDFRDTTYLLTTGEPAQPKNALVEDFTGVKCSNCPKGHHAIEKMRADNPGRIMAMSIHGTEFSFFTDPFTGEEDFRVQWGAQIMNLVGKPQGLPFGTIDRLQKSSTAGTWQGLAETRMQGKTPVNLYIEHEYDDITRELKVKLKAVFTDTMMTRPAFSVGILESHIISPQKDEELAADPVKKGIEPNYEHNHVLRTMPAYREQLLPHDSILPLPDKNRVIEKSFSIILNDKWKPENCDIIFFVHRDLEVIHAVEVKVK